MDTPALPDVEEPVFIACRRGAGRRMSLRIASRRGTKSHTADTDSRVYALRRPRDRGNLQDQLVEVPKREQRTFEQLLQVVDVLAVCKVKLVPQERSSGLTVRKWCNVSRSRSAFLSAPWSRRTCCSCRMSGRPYLRTGSNSSLLSM